MGRRWLDDYESEYDWYIDHSNEEAQDVVISELISWYEIYKKASINMNITNYITC
jgi:hypothetical protein